MYNLKTILLLLFLSAMAYGQKSTLVQNVNFRAKELKHYLNKTEDSLILEGDRTIYKVNLFNKDYDKTIQVNKRKVKIPLHDLDIGRYVIETVLINKRIIIVLFRNESLRIQPQKETFIVEEETVEVYEDEKEVVVLEDKKPTKEIEKKYRPIDSKSINDLLNYKRPIVKKTIKKRKVKKSDYNYWVYYKINSGHYSKTIRKMATKDDVDRLISRNQLDVKTLKGQSNILKIWEVFDNSMFLKEKELDKNYINTKSPYFNDKLYYTTDSYGFDINPQSK